MTGWMIDMLRGVLRLDLVILNDRVNILLDDVWDFDFVRNFVGGENLDFFHDGHFNDLNFRNSLDVIFMLSVMRERSFQVTNKSWLWVKLMSSIERKFTYILW